MVKNILSGVVTVILCLFITFPVNAQNTLQPSEVSSPSATESTIATESGIFAATTSAEVVQKIQEKKDKDITETSGKQVDKLVAFLEENPPESLSWNNFLEHGIRLAIAQGAPANVVVLVLLFPLIASIIAASRHVIGLRGFGIYIPAVLSVALASTGLLVGLVIFVAIIGMATVSRKLLKQLNLSYLPRTALLLWLISIAILAVLLLSPFIHVADFLGVSIFPILILVLLSENFLDAQANSKPTDAAALAAETIALAFVSGLLLRWEFMQHVALLEPELLIISTGLFNYIVGKFVGLRITEWFRFRSIIEE